MLEQRLLKLSMGSVTPLVGFQSGVRSALTLTPFTVVQLRCHNASSSSSTSSSLPKDAASSSRRRAVTIVNDTGAVPWKELSLGEKAARTTQQSFNLGIVLLGVGLTGAVATVLWLEVFSTDSKTAYFNRAADRIRADAQCRKLLTGDERASKRDIEAHGEPSWSRWARNRVIASRLETDRAGVEHLHMVGVVGLNFAHNLKG